MTQIGAPNELIWAKKLGNRCHGAMKRWSQRRGSDEWARSDRAVSHPKPDAIEIRWRIPPLPAKRDAPPNALPKSRKLPTITMLEPTE